MTKPPGWRGESARHSLAARGIRTTPEKPKYLGYGVYRIIVRSGSMLGDFDLIRAERPREAVEKWLEDHYSRHPFWGTLEIETPVEFPPEEVGAFQTYKIWVADNEIERVSKGPIVSAGLV